MQTISLVHAPGARSVSSNSISINVVASVNDWPQALQCNGHELRVAVAGVGTSAQTQDYMKNGLKKALLCAACVAASSAFAGSTLDGAFLCDVDIPSSGAFTFNVVMAVVTNAQGQTGIAPVALTPTNVIAGYGLGIVGANTFSGQTNMGQPFSFAFNSQTLSFSGTVGTSGPATLSCTKVF